MEETRQIMSQVEPGMSVGIFIGPEGGLEKEEVQLAMEHGARQIHTGAQDPAYRDSRNGDPVSTDVPAGGKIRWKHILIIQPQPDAILR